MTDWKRVTVVTRGNSDDASMVEYLLNQTPAPADMYQFATYTDGTDNYAVSSGLWSPEQLAFVGDPDVLNKVTRPGHVPPEDWDGAKDTAALAQARFDLIDYKPNAGGKYPPLAGNPNRIMAIINEDGHFVLSQLGLTRIPVE